MASVTTMDLNELEGTSYGPTPWRVALDAVSDFVQVTGDDPNRWQSAAPPGFAASALFAVAPDLLSLLYDRSVIHGEQSFKWNGPLPIGELFEVSGTVSRVRERGGVHFVTFDVVVGDEDSPLIEARSLFLASGETVPGAAETRERQEPPHSFRGDPGPQEVSASRADLIRYASATRDWNPVHWDHEAGVTAGLGGIVVHGLLQAGWILRVAAATTDGPSPLKSTRVRFRSPLYPARPAALQFSDGAGVLADGTTQYVTAAVEVADE